MEPNCQGVSNRRAFPCPAVRDWDISSLINECSDCDGYYMYCCQHNEGQACHHFPVFFIDGACSQNGKPNAKAGVGIVSGNDEDQRFSIAITDDVDDFPLRSNQRAELLAAYLGLLKLKDLMELRIEHLSLEDLVSNHSNPSNPSLCPIVATDSEYVVKGVTEWLPKWKRNHFKTTKGVSPANLDLFLKIEEEVERLEKANYEVGFWHIPRAFNEEADVLAKQAAVHGTVRT